MARTFGSQFFDFLIDGWVCIRERQAILKAVDSVRIKKSVRDIKVRFIEETLYEIFAVDGNFRRAVVGFFVQPAEL